MVYAIGDCVAHPLHGAGVIDSIEVAKHSGADKEYYVMRISVGDILVKIPKETSDSIGVRPIVEANQADEILNSIQSIEIDFTQNWNRRYRENMLKIKSGDLMQVASVIKCLASRDGGKGLSTAERKMLQSAKQIFISELVLAISLSYDEASARLDSALTCC